MEEKKGFFHEFGQLLRQNKTFINYIFLGVGLALFFINLVVFMSFVDTLNYSKYLFNISVFASIFIILVTVYNVTMNNAVSSNP